LIALTSASARSFFVVVEGFQERMNQPVVEEQNQATGAWEVIPQAPEPEKPVAATVEADDDEAVAAPVAEAAKPAEAKPAAKPRNDPQARIDQAVARQREAERRAEAAEKRAEELARAPRQEQPKPTAAATETGPDANDSAKYPGGEYDPKFLKDQARYEARLEFREQQQIAQKEAEDTRREREFDTRATSFVKKLHDANAVEAIDRRLLSGKPLSLLTSKERAQIAQLPAKEQNELGFICFLADQWNRSEHDVELVKYLSDPATFQRLATLPPDQVIWDLANYASGLGAASVKETAGSAPVPKPKSQATPPIQPVRGSSQPVGDDEPGDDASDDEWYRYNQKQAKRGR
jgi:hypothetical protein